MEELSQFMSLVSAESEKVQKIKEEKEQRLAPKIDVNKSLGDFFAMISEAKSTSTIVEAPKASGDHDLFKDKTYLQITIPEPKTDLEEELVKTKNATMGRSDKVIQSVKDHDTHSWFAIEKYLQNNNLEYDEGKCESLVLQSKPTIKYFKDLYDVDRPFEIDDTLDTLPSTTNKTRSYPSGHATQSMLVALYMSEVHPDHKEQFIKRAKECGLGRVVAGFHYPMDYTAGNILAEKMYPLMNREMEEAARIPRKKGQPAGSDKHSDLYTDENPKGTIKGLGFKDVATAKASVAKIKSSGRTHAHKIQAAIAMEQRARVMGKKAEAAVYRKYINQMKEKTKRMNKEERLLDVLEKELGVKESYEIGTDEYAQHTMKMTPGQPVQNFRKITDKITDKDLEKFKNEGETIDKYKKRFKENWKVELDKAVERMKEQL